MPFPSILKAMQILTWETIHLSHNALSIVWKIVGFALLPYHTVGRGSSQAHIISFTAAILRHHDLWSPNFVTSSFYPYDIQWQNLNKIEQPGRGGISVVLFSSRCLKTFWKWNNLLCLEVATIDGGINSGSKRVILNIKAHFFEDKPIFRE